MTINIDVDHIETLTGSFRWRETSVFNIVGLIIIVN